MIFYGVPKFLLKSILIMAFVAGITLNANAQPVRLVLGHNLQKDNPLLQLYLKRWANYFTQVTNNRGKIIFRGPQDGAGGKNNRFRKQNIHSLLVRGHLDIALVNILETPKRNFFYSKLFSLPFVARDTEIASKAFWEIANNYLQDEFKNLQLLSLHIDPYNIMHYGSRPPIQLADNTVNTILFPEDLSGLVIASNNMHASDFIKFSNGNSNAVPFLVHEKARSFTLGQMDGFWLNWAEINHDQLSFLDRHTVFKGMGTPYYLAFNENVFNLLPQQWRKILTSSLGGENLVDFAVEVTEHIHQQELKKLKDRKDLVIELNTEQQYRWRNNANLYIANFLKKPQNINDEALVIIFNLMQERMLQLEKQQNRRR